MLYSSPDHQYIRLSLDILSLQMKLNIGSQSSKQDYITWDQFIGDNGHGCLSNIKVYIGMKVIVTRCTHGTDVHLSVASLWTYN